MVDRVDMLCVLSLLSMDGSRGYTSMIIIGELLYPVSYGDGWMETLYLLYRVFPSDHPNRPTFAMDGLDGN